MNLFDSSAGQPARLNPRAAVAGRSTLKGIFFLVFLLLVASVVLLWGRMQKYQAEIATLRAQNQELEVLREAQVELEQLRSEVQEVDRLRRDNAELVRLRGEVAQLRPLQQQAQQLQAENERIKAGMQQLQKTAAETAALRNQNQQLQNVLDQQQQNTQMIGCVANLKAITAAKAAWAQEQNKSPIDIPADADLFGAGKYLPQRPACPAGGLYNLGAVQEKPACTIPGHAF